MLHIRHRERRAGAAHHPPARHHRYQRFKEVRERERQEERHGYDAQLVAEVDQADERADDQRIPDGLYLPQVDLAQVAVIPLGLLDRAWLRHS